MNGDKTESRIGRLRLAVLVAGSVVLLVLGLLAATQVITWSVASSGATVVLIVAVVLIWVPRLWTRR